MAHLSPDNYHIYHISFVNNSGNSPVARSVLTEYIYDLLCWCKLCVIHTTQAYPCFIHILHSAGVIADTTKEDGGGGGACHLPSLN